MADLSRTASMAVRSSMLVRAPRQSFSGSVASSSAIYAKRITRPEFEFNLGNAKAAQLKKLTDTTPGCFKRLFNSPLYDSLLTKLILYFVAAFQHESLQKTSERAKKQHLDGYSSATMTAKLRELREEALGLRQGLGPLYGQILLQYSDYSKPQKDRKFFEALYSSLTELLEAAFSKASKRGAISAELGLMFRSRHFNREGRVGAPPRAVNTLTVSELHAVKTEGVNRALNCRAIAALHEKPNMLAVQAACCANSPLIGRAISSPAIAKGMMMDPLQRKQLLKQATGTSSMGGSETRRTADGDVALSRQVSYAQTALTQRTGALPPETPPPLVPGTETTLASTGVFGRSEGLKPEATSRLMPLPPANEGLSPVSPRQTKLMYSESSVGHGAARGGAGAGGGSVAMPETAGLLHDETYYYLALLRRYVLYGPTMGLTTPAGAFGVKGSAAAATGAALGPRTSVASLGGYSTPTGEGRSSMQQLGRV